MLNSMHLTRCLLSVVAVLLVAVVWTSITGEKAAAQQDAGRYMISVVGFWRDNSEPVFIINTRDQTISVYEYDSEQNLLDLFAVRSYEYDRKLKEFPVWKKRTDRRGQGPSVAEMEKRGG
ncbi:MAG: hypothetical protein AB1696_10890 [Planctomycetota bacterium]